MLKYFIGITGVSTAGKSTLAATLLSKSIFPSIFPIPHTTRRTCRIDDDVRLIRCISPKQYVKGNFLTVDQNYGTLLCDIQNFLNSQQRLSVSIISCNEVPDLKSRLPEYGITPFFISLTLTDTLLDEEAQINSRFPDYFDTEYCKFRIQRDINLAKNYFFNPEYVESNSILSLSQEQGDVLDWVKAIQRHLPIKFEKNLQSEIDDLKSIR